MAELKNFRPTVTLGLGHGEELIRWGAMPRGKPPRALGAPSIVSIADSLMIYRAALHRLKAPAGDSVLFVYEDGRSEERNWAGELK